MSVETSIHKEWQGTPLPAPTEKVGAGTDDSETGGPSAHAESQTRDSEQDCEAELVAYRRCMESRDDLIRKAKAAGFTEVRIAQLTGHSRNTVRAALGHKSK